MAAPTSSSSRCGAPDASRRRAVLALGACALGPGAAAAAEPRAPVEVEAAWPSVRLQGRGTLRYLGFAVYEARLWSAAGFAADAYERSAFALELVYARRLEGAAIAERSIELMRRSADFAESRAAEWLASMRRAFPDVAPGDRLSGLHRPVGTAAFFHNGRATASIDDALYARLFFGIWLDARTTEPRLRGQLLGTQP